MPAMVFHITHRASDNPPTELTLKREASLVRKYHAACTMNAPILTEAEYAELPLSIQRKYFSSLERLRIAEHTASVLSRTHQLDHQPPHRVRRAKSIPTNINGIHRTNSKKRQRLRKPEASFYDQLASQTEAQWFLNLPDKVRRQHFSREEQILLASRCDSFISPPELQPPVQPPPDLEIHPPTPESPKTASSLDQSQIEHSPVPFEQAVSVRFFRPDDMASCFDSSGSKRSRRPSFRRTLSIGTGSARHSTSSIPPLLPSPFSPHGSSHKRTVSAAPRASESSTSAFDPNAVHYSDPDARMKLRTYLGSPQKFDEALEFGFPANHDADASASGDRSPQILTPLTLSHDFQSFLHDDWLSFLDSDEDVDEDEEDEVDNESLPDADSPVTPGDPDETFRHSNRIESSLGLSPDPAEPPSSSHKHRPDPFSNALAGAREMTLRMTLTRPDLRAQEEDLYGWQGRPRDDPLALEELPVSDDVTGGQSPFGIKHTRQSSRMKRLLSMVKKERR